MNLTALQPENENWRFEYKYYLSAQQYFQVKNAIMPFAVKDQFTKTTPNQKYLVKSLYFDSFDFQSYHEKIDGNCDRIKLRIRTYSELPNDHSVMRAELKTRKGPTTEKHSSFINFEDYQYFIKNHHWPETNDPVLQEFERYFYLKNLQPVLLVKYFREGFRSRLDEDIRITFDHNVQSAHGNELFQTSTFFKEHHRHIVVLEIKCVKNQPYWLRNIVQQQGLKITSSSKFAKGIEISRFDIVNSFWSS